MSQQRTVGIVAVAASVAVLIGWQAARGDVDWLGQCKEGADPPNITNPAEQPSQKCMNLFDCGVSRSEDCEEVNAFCKISVGGVEVEVATKGEDHRSIQVGDCETPGTVNEDDKCWHCTSSKSMICYVSYRYRQFNSGDCTNRCDKPDANYAESGKCKP
jgi:hypothetical protein